MNNEKKRTEHILTVTSYSYVNEVLYFITQKIQNIFGDILVGVYLTGSLTYNNFVEGRSDIDLAVILKNSASQKDMIKIKELHLKAESKYPVWFQRIECSYIPISFLSNILPPEEPRPYFGQGIFYPKAPYGNEWIINQYFLYKYGVTLVGADFKSLTASVDIGEVQKACIKDLYTEWEPKIDDIDYLEDSHQQSYIILNLCRILYTIKCNNAVSKEIASSWVKNQYPQWSNLIDTANNWCYGMKMDHQTEVIHFIKFVLDIIKK